MDGVVSSGDSVTRGRSFGPEFQETVAGISARFVTVSEQDFDEAVQFALAQLGELFAVDRAYLFRFTPDHAFMNNTHEWCASGIQPQIKRAQNFAVAAMPWWQDHLERMEALHIPDVQALPPEAATERKELAAQNIQSLICLPLRSPENQLMGFIGLDAVCEPYRWSDAEIRMLKVIAEIMAGAITRHDTTRAMLQGQLRFEQLAEQSRTMIWEVDQHGLFTYVSPSCFAMLGYAPEELIGKKYFYDLHPAKGREAFRKSAFEVFEQRQAFRAFRMSLRPSPVSWSGSPLTVFRCLVRMAN